MGNKSCLCGWSLALAICLLITGVVVGSIGAAKYAPMANFINNAQTTTCTLQSSLFQISRCAKWSSCLAVTWNVTYPNLINSALNSTALVIDKTGLGYWDAASLRDNRAAGSTASCLIDANAPNSGYFEKPAQNYFAMLIVGWVLVLIGIIQCVLFGMFMCCGFKMSSFKCCSCGSSKYNYASNPTPLYNTTNISSPTSGYTPTPAPALDASDAEMTPIPPQPVGAAAYVPPTAPEVSSSASISRSSSASSLSSSRSDPETGGAGTTTVPEGNWGGYAE